MVKAMQPLLFLILVLLAPQVFALSCGIDSEKRLVDESQNIFIALLTSSEYVPDKGAPTGNGYIVTQFEVVESLKGDPEAVPHIESVTRDGDESWPTQIYLGKKYIVFAGNGPARFTSCSGLFLERSAPWCLEYVVRKLVGQTIEEIGVCEAGYIRREMERRGIAPMTKRNDLDSLRMEWASKVGTSPVW